MRSHPGLGATNFALVSVYFAPVWGIEALRVLMSPYGGFDDRGQAVAATYLSRTFGLGLDGLMRLSNGLAAIKLVVAAGFVAWLIEFARAIAVRREPNRETLEVVLGLAAVTLAAFALPALAVGDSGLIRLDATQLLLLAGAAVVAMVEQQAAEQRLTEPAMRPVPTLRVALPADLGRNRLRRAWRDRPGASVGRV